MLNIDKLKFEYYIILENKFINMIKSAYLIHYGWCPNKVINCKFVDDIHGITLYKIFDGEIELKTFDKSHKKYYQYLVHKYISKDLILL